MADDLFAFAKPAWITEAERTAQRLQDEANARWAESIGPHDDFSGFNVEAGGTAGAVFFCSTLFGGRHVIGNEHQLRVFQRAYIFSRSKAGKALRRGEVGA